MWQVLFRIPVGQDGLPVYGFGVMLFFTFIACTWMAGWRAELEGISKEIIQDIAVWLFLGGLVGARLTFLFAETKVPPELASFLALIPFVWDSPPALSAAVVGGLAAAAIGFYLSRRETELSPGGLAWWLFLGAGLSARLAYLLAQGVQPAEIVPRFYHFWEEGTAPFGAALGGGIAWLVAMTAVQFRKSLLAPRWLPLWVALAAVLSARLTELFGRIPEVWSFVRVLPMIWEGGIVLYGSLLGGTIAYFISWALIFRHRGLKSMPFIDVVAPCIAIGIALGRVGCLLNGCCYGQVACETCVAVVPISFPMSAPCRETLVESGTQTAAGFTVSPDPSHRWTGARVAAVEPGSAAYDAGLTPGMVITGINGRSVRSPSDLNATLGGLGAFPRGQSAVVLEYRAAPEAEAQEMTITPRSLGLYPTQVYETVSMLLLLLVLLAYWPHRYFPGQVMAVLMVGYGMHRYLNEILRDDPRPKGLETYTSLFVIAFGVVMWAVLWLCWKAWPDAYATDRTPGPTPATAPPS